MSLIYLCTSPTHRAALRLTGVAIGAPVNESLLADLAEADPVELAAIANTHFIHTLLSAAEDRDHRLDAALPEDLWLYFREMTRANVLRLQAGRAQLARIGTAFAAKGLTGVVLKGGVQMLDPAGFDVERRFINDLDILLPAGDAHRAHACLAEMGGTFNPHKVDSHHLPALFFDDPDHVVEIHTAVGEPRIAHVLPSEQFISRAQPSSLPGLKLPHPEDRYIHHVLHSATNRHDWHEIFLRGPLDHAAFCALTSPSDRASAHFRLEQANAGRDEKIISALTDLVLGREARSEMVSAKWLNKALTLYGNPNRRRMTYVTRTTLIVLRNFLTNSAFRRYYIDLLKNPNRLRACLRGHHDNLGNLR